MPVESSLVDQYCETLRMVAPPVTQPQRVPVRRQVVWVRGVRLIVPGLALVAGVTEVVAEHYGWAIVLILGALAVLAIDRLIWK